MQLVIDSRLFGNEQFWDLIRHGVKGSAVRGEQKKRSFLSFSLSIFFIIYSGS
jgi:hypothetical protein